MWHGKASLAGGVAVTALAIGGSLLVEHLGSPHPVRRTAPVDHVGEAGALEMARSLHQQTWDVPLPSEVRAVQDPGDPEAPRVRWSVYASRPDRRQFARFVCDGGTGELLHISSDACREAQGEPVRTPERAAERGWHWMQVTGLAAQCSEWRVHGVRLLVGGTWLVQWDGADRWACIDVVARSGACKAAYTSRSYVLPVGPHTSRERDGPPLERRPISTAGDASARLPARGRAGSPA